LAVIAVTLFLFKPKLAQTKPPAKLANLETPQTNPTTPIAKPEPSLKIYGYEIVQKFPHDRKAFTQGLVVKDGYFYESTGLPGRSSIRQVELETGKLLQISPLSGRLYGEGLTTRGEDLILLTWKAQTGFVIDPEDLSTKSTFNYPGEGWGFASSPSKIYLSDGTSNIRVLNPNSLVEESRFEVTLNDKPVKLLNELEWVEGELWSNVWKSNQILRINPESGAVTGIIDMTGLLSKEERILKDEPAILTGENVLNGIAYDAASKRIFVTGKFWPYIFEVKVLEK